MPGVGQTGIDDLYKVSRPDVDYVVIEYKFVGTDAKTGAGALGKTADGTQGSLGWTTGSGRIENAVGSRDSLNKWRNQNSDPVESMGYNNRKLTIWTCSDDT